MAGQQQEMDGKVINETDAFISLHALWISIYRWLCCSLFALIARCLVQNYYHFFPPFIGKHKALGKWKIRGSRSKQEGKKRKRRMLRRGKQQYHAKSVSSAL